jgi:tetratricopeptide (TPR) repeat protein
MQASGDVDSAGEKKTTLSVEGEIPCFIVFSDRKHVDYIYNIVNCVRACLSKRGFKAELLSAETVPDEHFGERFEKLADECVLGVVILDGFRPNILFEYGFLRGKGRVVIPLQDKKAFVAIKSLYSLDGGSDEETIKSRTGLTKAQFAKLREPSLGYFQHLSNRHGIKAVVVDCGAELDSCEHPQNKFDRELEKLIPVIVKKYIEQSMKPISEVSPSYFEKFHGLVLDISEYYTGISKFDANDVEKVISQMGGLEKDSGSKMPSRVYSMIASLYLSLVERSDWKDVHKIVSYYEKAIKIYEEIVNFEKEVVLKSDILKRIGDCHSKVSQYENTVGNCKLAIQAYHEALKVRTFDKFPMNYAMTQNNLGNAYATLGEVENTVGNCKLAIQAYHEALKVYAFDKFPIDYAMTQNNLGAAYRMLGEVENKAGNCKLAIQAYNEALKIYTEEFPEPHKGVKRNLERALKFCKNK